MEKPISEKYEKIRHTICSLGRAIVAFSGGVDSALVLKLAHESLGDNAIGITADSPSVPRREIEEARKIAKDIGANHMILNTEETSNEDYMKNPENRCYYCKTELYSKLRKAADKLRIGNIMDGTNFDDISDYRHGLKAAEEHKIISPLKDAMMTKNEVRMLARELGIPIWEKPASPCLSSRIPHGQEITLKKLSMVEEAENYVKDLGIKELRVRHFGQIARIDIREEDRPTIHNNFSLIKRKFNEIGFKDINISNFKSGSLNILVKGSN